jgi:predicted aspartyl protease
MAIKVGPPLDGESFEAANRRGFADHRILTALIDTGAPYTAIRREVLRELGLSNSVSMVLLNNPPIRKLDVAAASINQPGVDCVIGRDILRLGSFWYDGRAEEFTLMISGDEG